MANRAQFTDLFFEDALPALEDVIMEKFEAKPDIIPEIFNMGTSDKWGEQSTTISGLGNVAKKAEGADVIYDDILQGYDKTYRHSTYALGIKFTKEFVDDEMWGLINKAVSSLGKSMFNTRQIEAASIFNNAFVDLGPDGQPLISGVHPLIGGGTFSNQLAAPADLSVASLREGINVMEDTVDDRGILVNIMAHRLLVPNELQFDAEELLKSALRSDNANNAINAFQMKNLDYVTWNYLTDDDAWFLLAEKEDHDLNFIEREPVNTSSDYDFDADAAKMKVRNRFSYGYNDPRGVVGSPGA